MHFSFIIALFKIIVIVNCDEISTVSKNLIHNRKAIEVTTESYTKSADKLFEPISTESTINENVLINDDDQLENIVNSNTKTITDDCIINLSLGKIRGNCSNLNYDSYTRIPYAKPPLGSLRFESPQPLEPWSDIKDARQSVSMCVQYSPLIGAGAGTEDCLHLNVYVPKGETNSPHIVLVYLYPGAFQIGSADLKPDLIMASGDTIFVTLNYRTGPLGFLSTNDYRIPGNFGLKDQRLAIDWVFENIERFGGDKKKIILVGVSAGGASVEYQMIAGNARAKAYVSLSGSALNPWAFNPNPAVTAKRFGENLNCSFNTNGDEFKDCLKRQSLQSIWSAFENMLDFNDFSVALFRPAIEPKKVTDAFLTRSPAELIRSGKFKNAPYLVGMVEGEGIFNAATLLQKSIENVDKIEELNKRWYDLCPLLFFYNDDKSVKQQNRLCASLKRKYMCRREFNFDSYQLVERMFSDEYFQNGIDRSVKMHRVAGQKVYRYFANLPTRYNLGNIMSGDRMDLCFGSVHGNDISTILPQFTERFPPQETSAQETAVAINLLNLIKSLVTETQPKYNNTLLPANTKNNVPDQCLYFTYGEHRIDKCGSQEFNRIDCNEKKSVRCI